MRHQAIYATHPNVVSVDDTAGAFDAHANPVAIDEALVQAEVERLIAEQPAKEARATRDRLIAETDWMALSDVQMSDGWAAYRQALRYVPEQPGFPDNIDWPQIPGGESEKPE